jgi:hypothetical protein
MKWCFVCAENAGSISNGCWIHRYSCHNGPADLGDLLCKMCCRNFCHLCQRGTCGCGPYALLVCSGCARSICESCEYDCTACRNFWCDAIYCPDCTTSHTTVHREFQKPVCLGCNKR